MKKRILSVFLALTLTVVLMLCACSAGEKNDGNSNSQLREITDRTGASYSVVSEVNSIVSLSPAVTGIVIDAGAGEKLCGVDTSSAMLLGVPEDAVTLDMQIPSAEGIIAMSPDVVFASSMTLYEGADALDAMRDGGICVVIVPVSESIDDIKADVSFVCNVINEEKKGEELVSSFTSELSAIEEKVSAVTEGERLSVYMEIGDSPSLYTFGSGVFLDELISLCGGVNVFSGKEGWLAVSAEEVVNLNPDVIFTNIDYLDDPVGAVLSRESFAKMNAVKTGRVYLIDSASSAQPNHRTVKAVKDMAQALYPDLFSETDE